VTPGSWLAGKPEWLLGGELLNLGNVTVRQRIADQVDAQMRAGHVEVLRTDFNMDPLPYWQTADADDRVGITENRYVTGLLAYWDDLLARDPRRWIDTCASGGRRNDLETLRRAVPLLRSDWAVVRFGREGAIGQQAQTWGISLWMPYHGTGAPCGDPYVMRSSYVPAFRMGWDVTDPKRDPTILRRSVAEFRRVAPYMLGDFHPLTPYSLDPADWMAWQYDAPAAGGGAVQAFRRQGSEVSEMRLKLKCLTASAVYEVEDLDTGAVVRISGRVLMNEGLTVRIASKPGSALFVYRRERAGPREDAR
jgi:alpha-galactosidase